MILILLVSHTAAMANQALIYQGIQSYSCARFLDATTAGIVGGCQGTKSQLVNIVTPPPPPPLHPDRFPYSLLNFIKNTCLLCYIDLNLAPGILTPLLNSSSSISNFISTAAASASKNSAPFTAVLPYSALSNQTAILSLSSLGSAVLSGLILVADDSPQSPTGNWTEKPHFFSYESTCPNCPWTLYANSTSVQYNWNPNVKKIDEGVEGNGGWGVGWVEWTSESHLFTPFHLFFTIFRAIILNIPH